MKFFENHGFHPIKTAFALATCSAIDFCSLFAVAVPHDRFALENDHVSTICNIFQFKINPEKSFHG